MGVSYIQANKQGEKHPAAKLSEAKVRAIRKLYDSGKFCGGCLARIYGVSISTIYDIIHYRTWIHLR